METQTEDISETIRKEALDFLNGKYSFVKDVPAGILKTFPFIDREMVFEIQKRKIALMFEKEIRAPRWVAYVGKHLDVLKEHDFEMGIITLQHESESLVFPKYRDIEAGLDKENFGLYLIRNGQLDCLCHNRLLSSCARLVKEKATPLFARLELNKHVPCVVTDGLKKLQKVSLSCLLKDIAIEYDASTFGTADEEYDFVQKAMESILEQQEFKDLDTNLGFLRLTDNELRTKGKRDHFLHSFQVFLLGDIIIDGEFDAIKSKLKLGSEGMLSLERSWLLASLLHDIGIPFQSREWIDMIGDFQINLLGDTRYKHFIDDLVTCFSSMKGVAQDSPTKILYDRAKQENARGQSEVNHGLISAMQLLRKTMDVPLTVYKNEVLPAALSMAIHDKQIWHDLARYKLTPIDGSKLPIAFLLILCDNMEAWGRPGRKDDTSGKNIALTNLEVSNGVVNATLLFNKVSDALVFRWETQELLCRVISGKELFGVTINQVLTEN